MRYLIAGSMLVLLSTSACGGGGSDYNPPPSTPTQPSPTPPVTGSTVVSIPSGAMNLGNAAFGSPVSVRTGATVTWSNGDTLVHNIAADNASFNSGTLAPGNNFNFTFSSNGTFPYHCNIHPTMRGTVTVQP